MSMTDIQLYDTALRHTLLAKAELRKATAYAALIHGPLKERVYKDMTQLFPSEAIESVLPRKPKRGERDATTDQAHTEGKEGEG